MAALATAYQLPPEEPDDPRAGRMSFVDHLDELRRRLIRACVAVAIGMAIAFAFIDRLVNFVLAPMRRVLPPGTTLIYTDPAEAFSLYPEAEWVWLIDTDIIMMQPDYDLVKEIVGPDAIKRGLMRDTPILDGQLKKNPTNINTPKDFRVEDIDILITQDHQSVNTGSTFFRRSAFTRWTLEMMTDYTMLMGSDHPGAEQDAIKHLMLEHQLVRNHVGIYPQRKFNAYVQGGDNMGYRDGDLLVHFAGCWVGNACQEWFEEFWGKKGHKDVWRPEGGS